MNSQFYTAAVIKAMLSSKVLFAVASEDAERVNASPIPPLEILKLLLPFVTLPKNRREGDGHFCHPLQFHINL